jgi:hypothetical protein
VTETQLRFLRAIAERLPADRVAEVHLFPAMRQGTVETGVAVVAVEPLPKAAAAVPTEPIVDMVEDVPIEAIEAVADADVEIVDAEADVVDVSAEVVDVEAEVIDVEAAVVDADVEVAVADDSPYLEGETEAEVEAAAVATVEAEPQPAPIVRHIVYSARYRHTLKGPERGKWEADVTAEADAPLITVEAVVRGVRDRSGEAAEPERLTGEEFHAALAQAAAWQVGR